MMTILGGLLWVLAATPAAKPQAEIDAALKAVKTGDEKARKDAYATLWKLGVRIPSPTLKDAPDGDSAEDRFIALKGTGVLACKHPLWARFSRAYMDSNRNERTTEDSVAFAWKRKALKEGSGESIELGTSGQPGSNHCDLDSMGTPEALGLRRHPAIQQSLQQCCGTDANCVADDTLSSLCGESVVSAAKAAYDRHHAQAEATLTERLRECYLPKGSGYVCEYTDSPACTRHRECLETVAQDSLKRGSKAFDAEFALWFEAVSDACGVKHSNERACTLIVVDPCRGRVGYRCSDESIRELQVTY
ncbi:hypothetical protein D7V97_19900 [Corallococcus sp. CA053C]|uniref:hypothetical protein n=1 Tax=Corallococcus sp. CA053C TaxID=2316732 RepID=UPI000EA0E887|nr:hypothetical protein [Corallococcus sp. CA053C]RKH08279.1 hypothetical protein D7V97_19900 [Corallococcus sp. CA053C]